MSMTINPPAVVDEESFSVRRSIRIAAPVEKVWSAITDPAHISQWFGQTVLDGAGPGATGTMSFEGYGAIPLRIEAVDAPREITYRWGNDDAAPERPAQLEEETSTVFTFTLAEVEGGTQLSVVETGFERTSDPLANVRDHGTGWTDELDKLVALLEGGA
ncbi:SRPBCC domain-containing protein [Protaetiibacter sp. SSC-01]|uniref:SRPBCC domain-containing protein n=1 Tax=Protaetiibacter sp. SSC-01 TaxID=2759943 RepID=UPI001657484E|nr:SRPBCC domain-containing protein [Protaetiibacter sp. SSC-01]QNO37702.1 SRPBCC domain-containing protein [Protaetiibacter sp. SSC-01]